MGIGYSAKYKGRSFAWGVVGLLTIIGLMVVVVLHDKTKDRLTEMEAQFKVIGEDVP